MAKNEFLPFGIADGANVVPNEEYGKLAARTNGFSSGVAKSQELNKVWRQASVIASVVAQFIAETNNQDVLDDGNTAALRAGLLNALRATVGANIPVASQTTAGIAKLSNATNSNSEMDAATPRAVKATYDLANTANQNAGNAITNAANANTNANSRLEKNQNGADIPNKPKFVENLGLTGTVDLAENAYPKTGGQITGKVYADNDIEAKGWVGATTLHDRHKDGRWSRAYSEAFPPTAAVVGAYSIKEANDRYALKKSNESITCGELIVKSSHDYSPVKWVRTDGSFILLTPNPPNSESPFTIYERTADNKTIRSFDAPKKSGEMATVQQLLGIGQNWTDVTSIRENRSSYKNSTDKPIVVYIESNGTGTSQAFSIDITVSGFRVAYRWTSTDEVISLSAIVPPGETYRVQGGWGSSAEWAVITKWMELR
ncbi:phage tail protein [Xenorhabdus sp. XENO-7]|uniref:Phage tail protein n=1 Tax=Xenorhabdus aichiensis TaxID=3025874 RepID=A0ABT5M504_9GAMM|nr:phage tail protein [Xenorhabdus aichiensis]MDC9622771.1 phage tail protein [Xenorhabdus aichiensis]